MVLFCVRFVINEQTIINYLFEKVKILCLKITKKYQINNKNKKNQCKS